VRLGLPAGVKGLGDVVTNTIHSTGVGLLLYARENALPGNRTRSLGANARGMVERMSAWFKGNF
jgi:cell division protein FtsA